MQQCRVTGKTGHQTVTLRKAERAVGQTPTEDGLRGAESAAGWQKFAGVRTRLRITKTANHAPRPRPAARKPKANTPSLSDVGELGLGLIL